MTYGQKYSSSVSTPTKTSGNMYYKFLGYYYNDIQYFNSSGSCVLSYNLTSDVTMTAKWAYIYTKSGNTITFGFYWQTIGSSGKSFTASIYGDAYSLYAKDGTTTIDEGTSYKFKYEPIEWEVLTTYSDGTYLLLSKYVIDAKDYDYVVDSWLTNFKKEAFPSYLKEYINGISLLTDSQAKSYQRIKITTDYARANGAYFDMTFNTYSCPWWAGGINKDNKNEAYYVDKGGNYGDDFDKTQTYIGVVPALVFNPKGTSTFTSNQKLNESEDEKELSIERTFAIASDNSQDILLDDKKKSGTLLFVDKRYMSNGYEAKNFQI